MQLYHRYVRTCIGQTVVYVEFGTIRGSRHPLGVLECILHEEGGTPVLT